MSGGGMSGEPHPVLGRASRARAALDGWRGTLGDAYRLCMPGSRAFQGDPASRTSQAPVDASVFDGTAADAIVEWASRQAYGLGLGFKELVDFKPGEGLRRQIAELGTAEAAELEDKAAEMLNAARDTIHDALSRSNLIAEAFPAMMDAAISTGVLLVHEGDWQEPIRFEAVRLDQVAFSEGPTGRIENVYRAWQTPLAHAQRLWPQGTFSDEARKAAEGKPDAILKTTEAFEWEPATRDAAGSWRYTVVEDETGHVVIDQKRSANRWILFRIGKAPGEAAGIGPALRRLPDIKTANKVVELVLKNASLSVVGLWQAEDDGVLNPATIKLVPGSIIPKAPGSAGLTPLQSPGNFDVSQIILADLREGIRRSIAGPTLPGVETGVRSATEWGIRDRETVITGAPANQRLFRELVMPLYQAAADILARLGLLGNLDLVGGTVLAVPRSPYADMANRAEMANRQVGLQVAAAIDPMATQVLLQTDVAVKEALEAHGWEAKHFRSPAEQAQRRDELAKAAQAELAARTPTGRAGGGTAEAMP